MSRRPEMATALIACALLFGGDTDSIT